ncbi:MAG: SDR family NAD(P)-dependent oxidoreductase [Chitinophagales bacterium]
MKKYWFIIGTGSGIGKALAEYLLQDACVVHGISRHNTIEHPDFHFHALDLSDAQAVAAFTFPDCSDADELAIIYNAGTLGAIEYVGAQTAEHIQSAYQINCVSAHILFNTWINTFGDRSAIKMMAAISTGAATYPYDGWSIYSSTKAALLMLCQAIAKEQEIDQRDISVYSIAPGVVDTDMQKSIRSVSESQFSKKDKFVELYEKQALRKVLDVAPAIVDIMRTKRGSGEVIHRIT